MENPSDQLLLVTFELGRGAPFWAKISPESEGESRKYISKYIEVNA